MVKKEYSYTSTPPMGRKTCTEPQCLYKGVLCLTFYLGLLCRVPDNSVAISAKRICTAACGRIDRQTDDGCVLVNRHLSLQLTNLMHKICFTISLFHASSCFEHHVLIVRRSKLYYTASGIITPVGGCPVHGTATYTCDDAHGARNM